MRSPALASRDGTLHASPEIHNILTFKANQQPPERWQELWVCKQTRSLYRPIAVEFSIQLALNHGCNTHISSARKTYKGFSTDLWISIGHSPVKSDAERRRLRFELAS
jgi:hypothetical protein